MDVVTSHSPKFIAISSGKGGVGKTFFAAHLARTLSSEGHKVCALDLSDSGANLHSLLCEQKPLSQISQWFSSSQGLEAFCSPTQFENLSILMGHHSLHTNADIKLFQALWQLPFDYIILDLGAGPSWAHSPFYQLADKKILLSTPEPASIEGHYQFLKHSLYTQLTREELWHDLNPIISDIFEKSSHPEAVSHLLEELQKIDSSARKTLQKISKDLSYSLVMNQLSEDFHPLLGEMMIENAQNAFSFQGEAIGNITHNSDIFQMWQTPQNLRRRFSSSHQASLS